MKTSPSGSRHMTTYEALSLALERGTIGEKMDTGINQRMLRLANKLKPGQAVHIPTAFVELAGEEMGLGLERFIEHVQDNWGVLMVSYKGQYTMMKPQR